MLTFLFGNFNVVIGSFSLTLGIAVPPVRGYVGAREMGGGREIYGREERW